MSTPKNKLDAYARTLTDRIAELEAQLEAVVAGGVLSLTEEFNTDALRAIT